MHLVIFGKKIQLLKEKDLGTSKGLDGYYCPLTDKIVVDAGLKGRELLQTLIHEINHSAAFRTGLMQAKISEDAWELISENLATALVENLADSEVRSILKRLFK